VGLWCEKEDKMTAETIQVPHARIPPSITIQKKNKGMLSEFVAVTHTEEEIQKRVQRDLVHVQNWGAWKKLRVQYPNEKGIDHLHEIVVVWSIDGNGEMYNHGVHILGILRMLFGARLGTVLYLKQEKPVHSFVHDYDNGYICLADIDDFARVKKTHATRIIGFYAREKIQSIFAGILEEHKTESMICRHTEWLSTIDREYEQYLLVHPDGREKYEQRVKRQRTG
jgi:hypothetical protein